MISRLPTSAGTQRLLNDINRAGLTLNDLQNQLTSGKRISKMSDAPADAVVSLAQRAELRRAAQFDRNSDQAADWLGLTDTALSSATSHLTSVRTLLVQAQSPSGDATSRAAIAGQITAIRDSLISIANSQNHGRPLFGGTTAGTAAYDAAGNYLGDNGNVAIPVSPSTAITVNQTGPAVFGTHNASDPTAGDVFQLLTSLATAVTNGDTTAMGAGLDQIDTAATRVANAQVQVGSRTNQLDALRSTNDDTTVALKASISKAEDVDLASTIVEFKTREASYQAALQATARITQQSLMDFLR